MASERYLLGEMSEVERFEFEAHYFECAECADDVRVADMIREESQRGSASEVASDVVSGFSRTSSRTNVIPFWRRPIVAIPWAAAAALALMVSYQSLVTVPALKNSVASETLSPVMLRGATRGTGPVVAIAPGQHYVTLAVDVLTPPSNGAVRYELLRAGGAHVLSGGASITQAGTPLMLLVPAAELDRGARYSLIIRSADTSNALIGEYDFDVS